MASLSEQAQGQPQNPADANPRTAEQETQPGEPPAPAIGSEKAPDTSRYENPCGYENSHNDSDLCAQWTAAKAAQTSASWVPIQAKISMLEAGALGLSLIISAIAAIAAFRALRLTKRAAQAQTRAYVYPSLVSILTADDEKDGNLFSETWATVVVEIKNYGQSPAKQARAAVSRELWAFPPPKRNRKPVPSIPFDEDRSDMPPGNLSENRLDFEIDEEQKKAIRRKEMALYVFGRIEYTDTFGDPHFTNFLFYTTGDDFEAGNFRTHAFGNEAS